MDIAWIRTKVSKEDYEFSAHADEERQADRLMVHEIERALLQGEILESYPNDPKGESCLVLGYGELSLPIHIVCGKTKAETLRIITVYIPTAPKWVDERTRRNR